MENLELKLLNQDFNIKTFYNFTINYPTWIKTKRAILFRKLPYTFTTAKPAEVRMGKGKGNHADWICPVLSGQILIEFSFVNLNLFIILNLLRKCMKRLPLKTNILTLKHGILAKGLDRNFSELNK